MERPDVDPYEVLGLEPGATHAEIRAAYLRLAKKHHPDKNPGDKTAEWIFKAVQKAYETLRDGHGNDERDRTRREREQAERERQERAEQVRREQAEQEERRERERRERAERVRRERDQAERRERQRWEREHAPAAQAR